MIDKTTIIAEKVAARFKGYSVYNYPRSGKFNPQGFSQSYRGKKDEFGRRQREHEIGLESPMGQTLLAEHHITEALNKTTHYFGQWYLNGEIIPNGNTQSIIPSSNGIYTVEVGNANGCSNISSAFTFSSLSIEHLVNSTINIYPNPSSEIITISSSIVFNKIEVINVLGQEVNVFEALDFPAELDGDLADLCFSYLADPKEAIAIRCASMTVLEKICLRVPELKSELRLLLEEHEVHGSAGFRNRARKLLIRLGKPD